MNNIYRILRFLSIFVIFTLLFPASIITVDHITPEPQNPAGPGAPEVQPDDQVPGDGMTRGVGPVEPAYARSQPQTRATWIGTYKVVVICAKFPDKNATIPISTINQRVNTNMKNYYDEVSYGQFAVEATIANNSWLMMPNNITYYTRNNKVSEFINDALEASDPFIDYNQFRTSGSSVYLVVIVHTGQDEATSGNPDDIWSHMGGVFPAKNLDNSWVVQYCTVSEFSPTGTFAHEFGHLLGLPDLYDNDYSSDGIGIWGVMGSGSHLNGGTTPGHFSAWSKIQLGWLSPTIVSSNLINQPIPNVEDNQVVYKIPIPITNPSSDEYFLVENRYRTKNDWYLPASGLLIWHIDDSLNSNANENHKLVDVEESTSTQHLDDRGNGNIGDSSDVWSNSEEGFTPYTDPNSKSYSSTDSKFYLQDIGAAGQTMYADFIVRHIYFEVAGGYNRFVTPGSEITISINVTSDRSGGDTLDFALNGNTNIEWAELLTLGAAIISESAKSVAQIRVTIPSPEYPNNFCELSITAHSTDSTEYESGTFRVTVAQYYDFRMDGLPDIALNPKESKIESFKLFNSGNSRDKFTVKVSSSNSWNIILWESGDAAPEIDPYSNRTIDVFVEVPAAATSEQKAQVTVNVVSEATSTEHSIIFNVTVKKIYDLELIDPYVKNKYMVNPGTTAVYDYTVTNKGNTPDTITISVLSTIIQSLDGNSWTATVKPETTLELASGQSQKISLEIVIPEKMRAGDTHRFDLKILSEDGSTNESADIVLEVEHIYGMSVELDSFSDITKPLQKAYFNFKITNSGNGNDTFNISLTSALPDGWILTYPENADLVVLSGKTVKYTMVALPPALQPAGDYRFAFKVISLGNKSLSSTFSEEIQVEVVHSVDIAVLTEGSLTGKPGEPLNFTISIENTGNAKETVSLTIAGTVRHGLVVFKESLYGGTITTVELNPGEQKTIIVVLSLFETISEDSTGAVSVEGILGDDSKTQNALLLYNVEVPESDDTKPPSTNGDGTDTQGLLAGTTGLAILAVIIIMVILIVVILFVIKGKKKDEGKKNVRMMAQQQVLAYNGYGHAPAAAGTFSGEVVADFQMVETVPRYDMQAGQVSAGMPGQPEPPRFDPQTGEPLAMLPEPGQNGPRFDPQTGEPLEQVPAEYSYEPENGIVAPVESDFSSAGEVPEQDGADAAFECPDCGAAITAEDPRCPGCGVEFE